MKPHSGSRSRIAALTALALLLHPALLPQASGGNPRCRPHAHHAPLAEPVMNEGEFENTWIINVTRGSLCPIHSIASVLP